MNRCIAVFLIAFNFFSCNKAPERINQFADSVYVSIGKFQDKRNTKALLKYLKISDPDARAYAALAFASVQDTSAIPALGKLLQNDPDIPTRKAAAFAIGQTRCRLSEEILLLASDQEKDPFVLAEIVEGYGKVARQWNLDITPLDTIVSAGLAWSIYHAGIAGVEDSTLHKKASQLLNSSAACVRVGAANYFSRGARKFSKYEMELARAASSDHDEVVRMAATLSLRKTPGTYALKELERIISTEPSYRVKVNAVRALGSFPVSKSLKSLLHAVSSDEANVAITASETLLNYDTTDLWKALLPLAKTTKNWRVQANLYEAATKGSASREIDNEIISLYKSSPNPYQKAALLNALSSSVSSFDFIREELFSSSDYAIKTSAATAIVAMNKSKHFKSALKSAFADTYAKGISTADIGLVSIFGGALSDPTLDYKTILKDTAFLYSTRKKLRLPKDMEGLQSLESAIAYFEGRPVSNPLNTFNHPIDWKMVKEIPAEQRAVVATDKGDITIRLLINEAPGSVVNFVSLAKSKYFDGKNFHRVVPNFVAQGGCNRGDGYGGEDYSIRSEFSQRRYTTGSIGMASAGKDTEGTQWFITHSPTPHLDGKYTIFAVVESGMEIVHRLEIGDKIIGITFSK